MQGLQRVVEALQDGTQRCNACVLRAAVPPRSAQTTDFSSSDSGLPGSGRRPWWRASVHCAALRHMATKSVIRAQRESGNAVLRPPPQNGSGTHVNKSRSSVAGGWWRRHGHGRDCGETRTSNGGDAIRNARRRPRRQTQKKTEQKRPQQSLQMCVANNALRRHADKGLASVHGPLPPRPQSYENTHTPTPRSQLQRHQLCPAQPKFQEHMFTNMFARSAPKKLKVLCTLAESTIVLSAATSSVLRRASAGARAPHLSHLCNGCVLVKDDWASPNTTGLQSRNI